MELFKAFITPHNMLRADRQHGKHNPGIDHRQKDKCVPVIY